MVIGTRPYDDEHFFAKLLAGGAGYSQKDAAAADDAPFQKRTWLKAIPSLRIMPDLKRDHLKTN